MLLLCFAGTLTIGAGFASDLVDTSAIAARMLNALAIFLKLLIVLNKKI